MSARNQKLEAQVKVHLKAISFVYFFPIHGNTKTKKVCRRRDELFIHFQVAADILEAMAIVAWF